MNASRWRWILLVVLLFSALAAGHARWLAKEFPDELEYWTLGENLVQKDMLSLDGVNPSAYRPPLVAWVVAPLIAAGASRETARATFVVLYSLAGIWVAVILLRLFSSETLLPALGVGFVLINPLYLFAAGNLYPQALLVPLFLAVLWLACLQPLTGRGIVFRSLGIGCLSALSLYATASSLFSLLPIFVILAVEDFRAIRRRSMAQAHRAIVAGLVVLLALAPYMYRNHRQVHPGVYLTLNSGINLLLGNCPNTRYNSGVEIDISEFSGASDSAASEFENNRRYSEAAVANIKGDPGRYVRLYFLKLLNGFDNSIATATYGKSGFKSLVLWSYMLLVWGGVVALLVRYFRSSPVGRLPSLSSGRLGLLIGLVLSSYMLNLAGYAIFFTRVRFRLPMDVALAILGAAGWYFLWKGRTKPQEAPAEALSSRATGDLG